ncbi:MAG: type IV pilus twitching motility protein PilT [bacterium]|nr:type IV pilus twitching motility protein PilT [bacterium]
MRKLDQLTLDIVLGIVHEKGASDLHLLVGVPPTLRLDGRLVPLEVEAMTADDVQRMLYDILTDEQVKRFETNMELDFSYALRDRARFRVNIYRDKGAMAGAFRLIPAQIPTLDQLGLPKMLVGLSRRPRGLILVTGPTGSGKSTTQAAMINQINNERNAHIITIEDPLEYLHTHGKSIINQRELGMDTMSFSNALRAALREDPDVILVGEMRDLETISAAITIAETGHLVLATLHTNNAVQAVDRMIDVFPPYQQEQIRTQLSNNLEAIVAQQLLPKMGQPGRVAAVEVMVATPAIRNLIREAKAHQMYSIIQTSAQFGMQTMDQSLKDLYSRGLISHDDAVSRAINPADLQKMIAEARQDYGKQRR